ncbi:MAG: decarboxylase [Dehalococcoidia bacterium]
MSWPETVTQILKENEVVIVTYVPDVITWRVLSRLERDPYFRVVPAAREEEAIGIVAGVYAAKKRGAVFMQSSGFGNCINALGSLCVPWRVPFPIFISMRGEPGEFNTAQVPVGRAVRPILEVLGLKHFTLTQEEEVKRTITEAIELCYAGCLPVALLFSTLLTGGKRGTE